MESNMSTHAIRVTAALLVFITLACDPAPDEENAGQDSVEVILLEELDPEEGRIVQGSLEEIDAVDAEVHELLDIAAGETEEVAGNAAKSVCTSWNVHCTKISLANRVTMVNSNTALVEGLAVHTNDSVNFEYTRMEHWIFAYGSNTFYKAVSKTNSGDWATKYGRGFNILISGQDGYQAYTRLCFNIKDDGKGELCTGYAWAAHAW
jgi:hypothetical protein